MSNTSIIRTSCSISGIPFTQSNPIVGEFNSSIHHAQPNPVAATTYEVPIFAENTAANKVKAFAISIDKDFDICKLVDANNASQFDIYKALGGTVDGSGNPNSTILAGTYIFPTGSGPFSLDSGETITVSGNDITDLRFRTFANHNTPVIIQAAIIYDK